MNDTVPQSAAEPLSEYKNLGVDVVFGCNRFGLSVPMDSMEPSMDASRKLELWINSCVFIYYRSGLRTVIGPQNISVPSVTRAVLGGPSAAIDCSFCKTTEAFEILAHGSVAV